MFAYTYTHTFTVNQESSTVRPNSFNGPLSYTNWMADALDYFVGAVKAGEFTMVQIVIITNGQRHEIHIENVDGVIKPREFDVTEFGTIAGSTVMIPSGQSETV